MNHEQLTHLDTNGRIRMVNVASKESTLRHAIAFGSIFIGENAFNQLCGSALPKGDAWASSKISGILAAKKTAELIPLCHPVRLNSVKVHLVPIANHRIAAFAEVWADDRTGVEMEAMLAVSTSLLNLYDMTKAVHRGSRLEMVRLLLKSGGKSGVWQGENVHLGKIEKLSISQQKGTPKTPCDEANIKVGFGVESDAHGGDWHRQVSLLAKESIEKMAQKGLNVDFGSFAENIATSGISLYELPLGSLIFIGDGVILEVTQIGKECHAPCAVFYQAGDCVMPKEGIFSRVLAGGVIRTGDQILALHDITT